MIPLQQYYNNIIKYELLRKFNSKNISNIPKLQKIILNFGCRNSDLKLLSTALLALELISGKRGNFTLAKKFNLLLKIKKGNPVGCKVTLHKSKMYFFLFRLVSQVLPKLRILRFKKIKLKNSVSYTIENTLIFPEFEKNYYLFNKLPELQVTLVTTAQSKEEFIFLLNSYKIPAIL